MTSHPSYRGLIAALVVSLPASAHAAYIFTSISVPGSTESSIIGINDRGQVAVNTDRGSFVYSAGVYTPIPNAPGFAYTGAASINNSGTIVGAVGNADGSSGQGFILNGSSFSFVSYPGATDTSFRNISNTGLISGNAQLPDGTYQGFLYNPSTQVFTDILLGTFTLIGGTNASGQTVGSVYPDYPTRIYSFLRDSNGNLNTTFDPSFRLRGINDQGLITGFTGGSASGISHGVVGTSTGFQYIDIPQSVTGLAGPVSTIPEGINDAGQISGYWIADFGEVHGFIASPATLPVATQPDGGFVFNAPVMPNVPIFIDPALATGYDYAIGTGDPLFASVILPIGIGDNFYSIVVGGQSFTVAGGDLFDFTTHGFANGVAAFRVEGIETDAALDPLNPGAFVTELTFVSAGSFTGTQTPLVTIVAAAPEPNTASLLAFVLLMLGWAARRHRVIPAGFRRRVA